MIEGKVVVVTGASSGIGAATAERLAAAGARVVLAGRDEERLAEVGARCPGSSVVAADVAVRADVERLVQTAVDTHGRLDVLVSNAGIAHVSPLADLAVERWDAMLDVNVRGPLYGIAAALPVFRAQGSGHFVMTLSTSGIRIVPGQAVYAGTKNAMRTICEALRQELAPEGIRVSSVSPGVVATPFGAASARNEQERAAGQARAAELGLDPDVVAQAIAYQIDQSENVDVGELVIRSTAQA